MEQKFKAKVVFQNPFPKRVNPLWVLQLFPIFHSWNHSRYSNNFHRSFHVFRNWRISWTYL